MRGTAIGTTSTSPTTPRSPWPGCLDGKATASVVESDVVQPDPDRHAVILPLDGRPDHDVGNPWELLARGDGMVVSWADGPTNPGPAWGAPLRATSALSRHITDIAARTGTPTVTGATRRYRLEIPSGYGIDDLMGAVGGGFRTAVRGSGGKIAGQATLVPLTSAGRRLAAAGPMLGLMALTIAAEMAGGDEQNRRLAAIQDGVERLNARFAMETEARLQTAEQTIRQAHAALLDGAVIPDSVGLGTAMSNLQVIRNQATALLAGWERVLAGLPPGETPGGNLRTALGEVGKLGWEEFPNAVRTAFLSITLDSRRIMLTTAEAQMRNPGLPLDTFRRAVESDLAARADEQRRLRVLVSRLATIPLTLSMWSGGILPNLVTDSAIENARSQALFATLSAALSQVDSAVPASAHRVVVDAEIQPAGEVQLLRPNH